MVLILCIYVLYLQYILIQQRILDWNVDLNFVYTMHIMFCVHFCLETILNVQIPGPLLFICTATYLGIPYEGFCKCHFTPIG